MDDEIIMKAKCRKQIAGCQLSMLCSTMGTETYVKCEFILTGTNSTVYIFFLYRTIGLHPTYELLHLTYAPAGTKYA
jgi:hypothetical protein